MSISRRAAQWALHTRHWHLLNCDRQSLDDVTNLAVKALEGRMKPIYTPGKDFGDHVVIYNSRHISLEGNMWEEHMYHFKSDWSQIRLKKAMKKRSNSYRHVGINRNFFISAEEAHTFDPTYVVRESIYRQMRVFEHGNDNGGPRDMAFGRLKVFQDDDVPLELMENISNVIDLGGVTKRLDEYTDEELSSFKSQFPELKDQSDYSVFDNEPTYQHRLTMTERAGLEGSIQEEEFRADLGMAEFYTRPNRIRENKHQERKRRGTTFM